MKVGLKNKKGVGLKLCSYVSKTRTEGVGVKSWW